MSSIGNIQVEDSPCAPMSVVQCPILIMDADDFCAHKYKHRLLKAGFQHVTNIDHIGSASKYLIDKRCDLVYISVNSANGDDNGFDFLESVRQNGYRGVVCMLCENPPLKTLFRAANLGANDILVKGRFLDIVNETTGLLTKSHYANRYVFQHDAAYSTGFFRSLGMTKAELDILVEFAKGFPRQRELAARLGKNNAQLHKVFSRIYQKLNSELGVDNPAKLSFLLTVCSFYR